jgi:hypothetical protein
VGVAVMHFSLLPSDAPKRVFPRLPLPRPQPRGNLPPQPPAEKSCPATVRRLRQGEAQLFASSIRRGGKKKRKEVTRRRGGG